MYVCMCVCVYACMHVYVHFMWKQCTHFCLSPMLITTKLASSQTASNSPRASLGGRRQGK